MTDPTNALSEAAPSLELLKKLPVELKCRFLLARLEKIGRHDSSALSKHNLMMIGDPWQLAYGYPDEEKNAVREHLINIPWTRLVNEGYLVDLDGQGFFKVSAEGKEFIKLPRPESAMATTPAAQSTLFGPATSGVPRVLMSYSWDGPEHKDWVLQLATRLQHDGIEVIFDQWHLHPGQEKQHFMEQAVAHSNFVVVVCTEKYAARANNREGGVGYESMIITAEMADHILTKKFIPVLRSGSFKLSLPIYIQGRMGVDLGATPYSASEYERLIRVIHGEPVQPPPIGRKPVFTNKTVTARPSATRTPVRSAPPTETHEPELNKEEQRLLLATAADTNGYVLVVTTLEGFSVVANNENFTENTPRSAAVWKRVLRRLQELGYLNQLNEQVYEITSEGFERADSETKAMSSITASASDTAIKSLSKPPAGSLLGPLNKRPNADLEARYDKPGVSGAWIQAIIRKWEINGEIKYSLETDRGDEFIGTKDDVISVFFDFNRKLIREGYKRMNFRPGADPEFQSL